MALVILSNFVIKLQFSDLLLCPKTKSFCMQIKGSSQKNMSQKVEEFHTFVDPPSLTHIHTVHSELWYDTLEISWIFQFLYLNAAPMEKVEHRMQAGQTHIFQSVISELTVCVRGGGSTKVWNSSLFGTYFFDYSPLFAYRKVNFGDRRGDQKIVLWQQNLKE